MTQPAPAKKQQGPTPAQVAALAALLAGSATATGVAAGFASLAGITPAVAKALLTVTDRRPLSVVAGVGPAVRQTAAGEATYRAMYLLNAADRVQARIKTGTSPADAVRAELGNYRAHLAAQQNRAVSAVAVDRAARRFGPVLGWRAVMDARTSAECRRADGKNFSLTSRPLIGWPGSVHPHCRCRPVAAFAGAGFVDDVATQAERKEAVA